MNNLLKELFIGSNLDSIEISGILSFKFSIDINSEYSEKYDNIIIDFISGVIFKDLENDKILDKESMFSFIGTNVSNCLLFSNNVIELILDNRYSILSKIDDYELLDRQWIVKNAENNFSIINDGSQIIIIGND